MQKNTFQIWATIKHRSQTCTVTHKHKNEFWECSNVVIHYLFNWRYSVIYYLFTWRYSQEMYDLP